MSDRDFSLMVWAGLGCALILALVASAGQRPASFTVIIPMAQVMRMDRSVWTASTRPTYQLQRVVLNGELKCLEIQSVAYGHAQSLTWGSAGGVQIHVTTTASFDPSNAMLWVFSTTPNQPRIVVPFAQEGAASQIDYARLTSTPYCP